MRSQLVPDHILDVYAKRFPHLKIIIAKTRAGDKQATLTFARNASYLETPKGISAQELWDLMGRAK